MSTNQTRLDCFVQSNKDDKVLYGKDSNNEPCDSNLIVTQHDSDHLESCKSDLVESCDSGHLGPCDGDNLVLQQCESSHLGESLEITEMDKEELEKVQAGWLVEQNEIKSKIVSEDCRDWEDDDGSFLVGGLDISFIVGNDVSACACYVVLNPQMEAVYTNTKMVQMTAPYIPGFLAFREAEPLCSLVTEQISEKPEVTPSLLMIDGNGILHPNRAGVASHIGVKLGISTIGVAKNLHLIPDLLVSDRNHIPQHLSVKGDTFDLKTESGDILGRAVKTTHTGKNPVFVSVGTGISLESGVRLVLKYSKYRIPEPTRQADIVSREYLRIHHPTARQIQPIRGQTNKQKNKELSKV